MQRENIPSDCIFYAVVKIHHLDCGWVCITDFHAVFPKHIINEEFPVHHYSASNAKNLTAIAPNDNLDYRTELCEKVR